MKGSMRAARFYGVNKKLEIEDIPIPKITTDEVLVAVKAAGICGSDIHIVYEGVTPTGFLPITLGHESSGIIVEVGENVTEWNVGDRVVVNSIISCGSCYNCLRGRESICINKKLLGIHFNGGLAQYMAVPQKNLVRLPENVPFEQGATCTDAVATPYHALKRVGKLQIGETIAVIGLGGLGVHAVQIAKIAGASKIIAIDCISSVIKRAMNSGATHGINVGDGDPINLIKEITEGQGVDLAIELVGAKNTISLGAQILKQGGRLVVVGLGPDNITIVPPTIFVRHELQLIGSYGWDRIDLKEVIELTSSGMLDLKNSVSKRYNLNDVNIALENLRDKVGQPVRLVIVQD